MEINLIELANKLADGIEAQFEPEDDIIDVYNTINEYLHQNKIASWDKDSNYLVPYHEDI